MKQYCMALDLKDDTDLIAEYDQWHKQIWPEVKASMIESGITNMIIYRLGIRLFMIMETSDDFSFDKKASIEAADPKVQEWEKRMGAYQQLLPQAKPGEKWVLMNKIFELKDFL
ncbi:MAG: L-rhamnose mutarotase [Chitinophagaceae bacterium]